ncbi:MAG: hypothetical protein EPO13_12380 [Actinomycetota bacterium]|nr:MAG: hypothetical protein EPO13_12380 [Actinomycetota bacterium]
MSCSAVAAASVLAKTDRDAIMVSLAAEHEAYGWQDNKGYAAPEHIAALREHGPCLLHRRSWSLPGTGSSRSAAGQVAVPEIGPATSLDPATLALPDVEWADSIEVTA